MTRFTLFVVVCTLCYLSVHATYYYELDLHQDDPPTPAAEIAFSKLYSQKEDREYYIRPRRQVSGGVTEYPRDETRTISYPGGPQTANSRGFTKPITYFGHGISGTASMVPGIYPRTGEIIEYPSPWDGHSRNLDKNFKNVGKETNKAGLIYTYLNNGANAFEGGSHTPGQLGIGSVRATANGGNTRLETTFAKERAHNIRLV